MNCTQEVNAVSAQIISTVNQWVKSLQYLNADPLMFQSRHTSTSIGRAVTLSCIIRLHSIFPVSTGAGSTDWYRKLRQPHERYLGMSKIMIMLLLIVVSNGAMAECG